MAESFKEAKLVFTATVLAKRDFGKAKMRLITAFKGDFSLEFDFYDAGYRIGESYLIFSSGSAQADVLYCGVHSLPMKTAGHELEELKGLAPDRKSFFTLPTRLEGFPELKPAF